MCSPSIHWEYEVFLCFCCSYRPFGVIWWIQGCFCVLLAGASCRSFVKWLFRHSFIIWSNKESLLFAVFLQAPPSVRNLLLSPAGRPQHWVCVCVCLSNSHIWSTFMWECGASPQCVCVCAGELWVTHTQLFMHFCSGYWTSKRWEEELILGKYGWFCCRITSVTVLIRRCPLWSIINVHPGLFWGLFPHCVFLRGLNAPADSWRMCSQVTHVKWPIKGAMEDGRSLSSAAASWETNQTRALSLKCKLDSFISHLPALSLFITHTLREDRHTHTHWNRCRCTELIHFLWNDIVKGVFTAKSHFCFP